MAEVARRDRAELLWDAFMVALALVSVGMVFYYDVSTDPAVRAGIVLADWAMVAIFAADFVWDLARAKDRRAFLRRNWWAPLGMVPLAVSELSAFRLLRLLRVLRVLRAVRALAKFFGATQRALADAQVARLGLISGAIMVSGSVLVWFAERGTNPALEDYGNALWWAVVTVTTVGYGDVTPHTLLGRVIASGLMVTGIGTIGLLAGQVGAGLIGKPSEPGAAGAPMPVRSGSVAEQLSQLAALRDRGDLTDAEFELAKERVLREP